MYVNFFFYFFSMDCRIVCIIIVYKFCLDEISFIDVGLIIFEYICGCVLFNIVY